MYQPPTNTVATACRFRQALDALEAAEESKLLNLPVPGRRENCNKGGHFMVKCHRIKGSHHFVLLFTVYILFVLS